MPAFVFIVLLNFFYLNYPVHSKEAVLFSGDCKACLKSQCHIDSRACTTLDHIKYQCFTCNKDSDGFEQFYTKGRCEQYCKDKKDYVCVCDGACIKCLPHSKAKSLGGCGQLPADKADGNCGSVPYNGKPNEGPDTKGSDSKNPPDGGYPNTGSNGKSPKTPPGGSGGKNGGSSKTPPGGKKGESTDAAPPANKTSDYIYNYQNLSIYPDGTSKADAAAMTASKKGPTIYTLT